MKDRVVPCIYYICANHDCKNGFKHVTMAKCKNCRKYPARKSAYTEPVKVKRQKDKDRHDDYNY